MPTIVEEALEYASLGWHLLPGIPGEKRPYLKWSEATCDPEGVTKLFEQFEGAEILVLCGPSKLAVLDLDGPWLDIPLLPYTWEMVTPRGGAQYVFSDPEGIVPTTASKLYDKVDTRGVGGLFVAPSVNSPNRRWRTKSPKPAVWPADDFPTLRRPRTLTATHDDEVATWNPVVGERLPNEVCPGSYHTDPARQPRLGLVRFPNGHIEARCWSGCDPSEVNPLLIAAGRFTAEELGEPSAPEVPSSVFITRDELMAIRPPVWMIDPYIQENALIMLAAKFNTGKTFVAVNWALELGSLGKKVLYIALEGLTGLQSRVRAWEEYYESLASDTVRFSPRGYNLNLLSDRSVGGLCADIGTEGGFDLVVVDNLGEALAGDENDSEVVGRAMYALNLIRSASGGAVLDLHNSGHAGQVRARGHSKMLDVHDTVIYLESIEGSIHGLKVISGKERNASRFVSRRAQLVPQGDSLVAVMGGKAVAEADPVYNAIKAGTDSAVDIAKVVDMPYTTVKDHIKKLLDGGDIAELPVQGREKRYETLWDKPV